MKEIKLTQGKVTFVDDEDFEYLNKYKWHTLVGGKDLFYATRTINNPVKKRVLMHREILGLTDRGIKGDHIDHNGLNNQRSNLRVATHSENMQNKRASGVSKFLGVSKQKKNKYTFRYVAAIGYEGKKIKLGVFRDEVKAAIAYNEGAIKYYGNKAQLNEI